MYASYGTTITPPGAANFSLSAAANNQNNPNVDPQESSNVEVGTKWDLAGGRLSLTGAVFHTINKNVLFTVDAVAVPPIFNQDDKQQVDGVTLGATGQITSKWQVLASFGYLDTEVADPERDQQRPAADAVAGVLGQRLDHLRPAEDDGRSAAACAAPPRCSSTPPTRFRRPATTSSTALVRVHAQPASDAADERLQPGRRVYIRNVNNNGARYNPGYSRTAQLTSVFAF